jgi:hypothetical protein
MNMNRTLPAAFSRLRAVPLIVALWVGLGVFSTQVGAQRSGATQLPLARFNGQITNIVGPPDNPAGFALLVRNRVIEIRLTPTTALTPMSAEASLAGLQVNDYAVVFARRFHKLWIASRVQFDVQPIVQGPTPVTVNGIVLRLATNPKRFQIRTDGGDVRWIFVTAKTTFRIDGQLQVGQPTLSKGDQVSVSARLISHRWVAVEVNLKSTAPYL